MSVLYVRDKDGNFTPVKGGNSGGATDDQVAQAVEDYLAENPVQPGATAEQAAQIQANADAIEELQNSQGSGGDGENGKDGFSPVATVEQTDTGAVITITDANGTTTATLSNGEDGAAGNGIMMIDYAITSTPGANTPVRFVMDDGKVYEITIPGGAPGQKGDPGDDYVLTEADRQEIAQMAAELVESPDSGGNVDYVGVEPAEDDIPRAFFGGPLQQTKDEAVVPFRYISKTQDTTGYAEIKAQGNSSMSYAKKNQTVKLFEDESCETKLKVNFKGWGKQNKHVYKANWLDLSHSRNVVSARLWADVVKSRANYAELPELLRTSPNQGAVDGFPVKVYADGVYQGRYTLNIPKDKWMANMDDELDNHCILCGENYVSGCFRATANINGSDWTDEVHDVVPASIKTRWNEVISFVMNSTDDEFRENLSQYFYVDSLIDYYLFGLASCGLDAFGKNQIYMTYDGQRWIASMYDMDSTWGLYWNGSKFVATDYARTSYEDMVQSRQGNLLYMRLEQLFYSELQTRWAELKNGALSIENIINRFERFTDIAPAELVKEDYASTTGGGKFTGIPSQSTNNIQQIRAFALARQAWTDAYVSALTGGGEQPEPEEPDNPEPSEIPCTGVTLDKTELTFDGEGSQTLTATVEPSNTTDTLVWSSDNTKVATVEKGVVTAVASGTATITATCGGCSATCTVSVSISSAVEPVYELSEATTFDGTNYIDTGIQLFNEKKNFTVLMEWEHTGESAFTNNAHVVLHAMREANPWPGIQVAYQTNGLMQNLFNVKVFSNTSDGVPNSDLQTIRIAWVYDVTNNFSKMSRRYNNSGNVFTSKAGISTTTFNETVLLGCYQDTSGNKGRYAKGIMRDCKIYTCALSDAEIEAYLNQ
jgi:hypothetical protein